jgi:hypothetical protein
MLLYELKFRIVWMDPATKPMAMKALYNTYNVPDVHYCSKYKNNCIYTHIKQYYKWIFKLYRTHGGVFDFAYVEISDNIILAWSWSLSDAKTPYITVFI